MRACYVLQATHVVTCITDNDGQKAKGAQRGVISRSRARDAAVSAEAVHTTWPTSEACLGFFFLCML